MTNALLLICPDQIRLRALTTTTLKNRDLSDAPIEKFIGDEITTKEIETIKNLLYSTSLFSPRSIIRISNADKMKTAVLDLFLKTDFDSPTDNLLLLTASSLKSNSRLRTYFKKKEGVLEHKALKDGALRQWTIEHGEELKVTIKPQLADLLIQIGENSPDKIHQLLNHLSLYCDTDSPTQKDVLTVFQSHPDPNEFELLEQALFDKTAFKAQKTLRELLENGKNPFLILGLLGKTVSRLLSIRVMLEEKKPTREIQQFLKCSDWIFKKQLALAKRCSTKQLKKLLESSMIADSKLKDRSLGPEWVLIELLRGART